MTSPAALGTIPSSTRTALLSLERRIAELEASVINDSLLHNGEMRVAQRGTSVTGVTTGGVRLVDRWYTQLNALGTWTITQEADGPSGFAKSLKVACTTADAAPAAGDYHLLSQGIEGLNAQHLMFGTDKAKNVPLVFYVKTNVPGTYIAELQINSGARFYNLPYTLKGDETWERVSLRFPKNTVTAITNDTAARLGVQFWLAGGSTYTGGAALFAGWHSTSNLRAVGQTNLAATVGNYWQITGVKLEGGDDATEFRHRSYGEELRDCLRYFWRFTGNATDQLPFAAGGSLSTSNFAAFVPFPVRQRAGAAVAVGAVGNVLVRTSAGTHTCTSLAVSTTGEENATLSVNTAATQVAGQGGVLRITNSTTAYIEASSEI